MTNPNKFALVPNNLCPRIRKQQTKKGNTNNTQVKKAEQEREKHLEIMIRFQTALIPVFPFAACNINSLHV